MPFDGLVQRDRLLDLLTELEIVPVSNDVLERHKLAEIVRHPPSRLWRYQGIFVTGSLLVSAMSLGMFMCSVTLWAQYAHNHSSVGESVVTSILTAVSFAASWWFHRGGKGPARWEEVYGNFSEAPEPIRRIAALLANQDSKINFLIGTLIQDKIDLDPYLLVEKYDPENKSRTRVCLGIWDGNTIIEIAQKT